MDDCLIFILECSLQFSTNDTEVSTVSFDDDGAGAYRLSFESSSNPLPIVQGSTDIALPSDCVISSLEVNRAAGWTTANKGGFNLVYREGDVFLEVK